MISDFFILIQIQRKLRFFEITRTLLYCSNYEAQRQVSSSNVRVGVSILEANAVKNSKK